MPEQNQTPAQRSLQARLAAYRLHASYDSRDLTAAPRRKFMQRFTDEVDPDRVLPPAERQRRAECAKKSYFCALSLKSAQARGAKKRA